MVKSGHIRRLIYIYVIITTTHTHIYIYIYVVDSKQGHHVVNFFFGLLLLLLIRPLSPRVGVGHHEPVDL